MKWPMTGLEEGKVKVNLKNLSEIKDVLGDRWRQEKRTQNQPAGVPLPQPWDHLSTRKRKDSEAL